MGPQGSAYYSVTDELRKSLSASVFEISCLLYKSLAKACACANGKMLLENNDDNDDNDANDDNDDNDITGLRRRRQG